jgi:hypothetical protein
MAPRQPVVYHVKSVADAQNSGVAQMDMVKRKDQALQAMLAHGASSHALGPHAVAYYQSVINYLDKFHGMAPNFQRIPPEMHHADYVLDLIHPESAAKLYIDNSSAGQYSPPSQYLLSPSSMVPPDEQLAARHSVPRQIVYTDQVYASRRYPYAPSHMG